MMTMSDRFRRWYDYECDCNAKSMAMLESVPVEQKDSPEFQKAIDKMAHLIAARRRWLYRLGHLPMAEIQDGFPKGLSLTSLQEPLADTQSRWKAYLSQLDDAALAMSFEWTVPDGRRYRWDIEGLLTQTFGHAWYHRGQIAHLVASLGGKAVDTDYFFWCNLTPFD